MTYSELACELKKMYQSAPKGETTTMIRLFGIQYAAQIKACGHSAVDIVRLAGIGESYQAEVNKGMQLAKYVELKKKF
ncbi:MAG: hypothetical protein PHD32_11445 [Eubacteriales bacterium]|nr:hypothetical protein [Eubacteriales bacterium]